MVQGVPGSESAVHRCLVYEFDDVSVGSSARASVACEAEALAR